MKKWITKVGAGALMMTFACSLASCAPSSSDTDYGYMTLDINPSIEFIIEDGIVVDVAADNRDGEVLLAGELLEGKTVKEATEIVVGLAESMGYLTAQNNRVKIVVVAENDSLKAQIESAATEGATEGGGSLVEINHEPRAKDKRKASSVAGNLSAAQVRLVEELIEYDDSITYEQAANMTIEELVKKLKELRTKYEGIDGEEIKAKFMQAKETYRAQLQGQINDMFGSAYSQMHTAYKSLEDAYEIIEEKVENIALDSADLEQIVSLLGLSQDDLELIASGEGTITLESIDEYMDKFYESVGANAEAIEAQVESILEKYDALEETYLLTQAEYDELVKAWGERQPALPAYEDLTLGDVEEFLETVEESVSQMETTIKAQFGTMQQQLMATIDEALDKLEETVHQQLSVVIQQCKAQYLAEKADRLPAED